MSEELHKLLRSFELLLIGEIEELLSILLEQEDLTERQEQLLDDAIITIMSKTKEIDRQLKILDLFKESWPSFYISYAEIVRGVENDE